MKKRLSALLIITALLFSSLTFSSFASAAVPKAVTYYTTQSTHLYKDKKGSKVIRTLPTNAKLYLRYKPSKGFIRVTYSKTAGYINVRDLSKSRFATYKDFEGSWYLGNKTKHIVYQIMITNSGIFYNDDPETVAGFVKLSDIVVKNNTLYLNHVTLRGDGTQTFGKLTQTLKLNTKNGKKVLVVSKPSNEEISGFQGAGIRK
ncbi:hypothetical protein E4665_02550 [Sporolactobacillus shoreae]|uniref:Uncharacterized protein n=1 Tax=Sporolactobacillus shoreae TaxID=1465501 RepID=A0A4Z0GSG5_9BACL|nr:hypothetical protein [Sporolactobacillus shoreae]TGA99846.1 hypothetical protein E4665_02550 [Sporolactobacillus shoreae]